MDVASENAACLQMENINKENRMATITMTFNVPDEEHSAMCAQRGQDFYRVIYDMLDWFRHEIEMQESVGKARRDALEGARHALLECISAHGLSHVEF
jgi:hypothetical protein